MPACAEQSVNISDAMPGAASRETNALALLNGQRPNPAPRVLIVHHDAQEAARLSASFTAAADVLSLTRMT